MVLPLNVTRPVAPELAALGELVWLELEDYLGTGGKRLKTTSFADARSLWISSAQQVRADKSGAQAEFADTARALVLELGKYAEFDTVIIPSLIVGKAPISGDTVIWDGVERALAFMRAGRKVDSSTVDSDFDGVAPVVSLHAVVLDAQGNKHRSTTFFLGRRLEF